MAERIPTLPCFKCNKELASALPNAENQPMGGTEFSTYGHYGAGFDPMDGTELVINICNECLAERGEQRAVLERRKKEVEVQHSYNYFNGF